MSLAATMEAAVRAHVGRVADELVPTEAPTWRTLFQLFPGDTGVVDITTAAGYGRPGQHPKNSPAWVRRRTFMRNLQRYRKTATGAGGQRRTPAKLDPRLRSIARARQRAIATPRSVRDVVRLMGQEGTTTTYAIFKPRYSTKKNPAREREIEVSVYTAKSVYRDVEWPMRGSSPSSAEAWERLGEQYLEGYAIAYGMPGELAKVDDEDDPVFIFTIGREAHIDYDYT